PTGFSPNGDGFNDELLVHGYENTTITSFRVFDRWGELVYERTDFSVNDVLGGDGDFRGKPVAAGVYIWAIEAVLPDGETTFYEGETSLLR
ncbi:MAG TPA: T9SS type B sorting domain-containing protein, partial [Saprospiraceae bacterium]|nr:T9SS type B sorting domain-containing protein [Saprospiraceae bacterium]